MGFTKSKRWREFRAKVLMKKERCEICGTKKNPQLHHTSYKHIFSSKNVVNLCSKHHRLIHFITGEKVVARDRKDVAKLRIAYKHMGVNKMRKLGLSIPIKDFFLYGAKESALYQYKSLDVPRRAGED